MILLKTTRLLDDDEVYFAKILSDNGGEELLIAVPNGSGAVETGWALRYQIALGMEW